MVLFEFRRKQHGFITHISPHSGKVLYHGDIVAESGLCHLCVEYTIVAIQLVRWDMAHYIVNVKLGYTWGEVIVWLMILMSAHAGNLLGAL